MRLNRRVPRSILPGCLLAGLSLTLATAGPVAPADRIPVDQATATPVPVAAWDQASPQKLVRLDGVLYQEDHGFYYRVIEGVVTIGLGAGVESWQELLLRAAASSPQAGRLLQELKPQRANRLGIVDLALPGGTPDEWARRVFETGLARFAEVATLGVYTYTPNDPLYSQQWALNNTGQTGGTPGADVSAEEAWDIISGDPSVIVGILDSGTLYTHPDLEDNIWINEDEIPGNSTDDDDNGFVDDWIGWDFPNNNNNPSSTNFHGTHVAGIVIGNGDNGLGIAGLAGGVDGSAGVRGMLVEVGSSAPVGSIIDDSLIYATDNGARVITMSLSVGSSAAINDALDYAYNQNDVFINNASGNNGSSVVYPANRPEVMAVASTTHNDVKSSFSNPGPEVQVAAPGSDILSTQLGNSYGSSSGTSFASPHVAALAALIRALNPGLSAPEVRQLIMDTADDVGPAGFDTGTGWGRINAAAALNQAGSSDGSVELDTDLYACASTVVAGVSDFDLSGAGTVEVTFYSDTEPAGETVLLPESEFGNFEGTVGLGTGAPASDGIVQVSHGDTLTLEYVDADDGEGGFDVPKTATASLDCQGPQIAAVAPAGVDDQSATIVWTTDEPGSSVVRYGTEPPLDQEVSLPGLVVPHVVPLGGLESCTIYKFEVESLDHLGNPTVDDNGGEYFTFQTLGDFPGVGVVPCQFGQVQLDRASYGCTSLAFASVTDIDLNLDSGAPDTAQVLMTSTTEPGGEWITVTETSEESGSFEGAVQLSDGGPLADGQLSVSAGDLITATYYDVDDGQGTARVATAMAGADCSAPFIQNVEVTAISSTRAEITWQTSEPATSRVEFGADAGLGSVAEDLTLETSHNVAISAWEACDRVYFRVSSADEFGDVRTADAGGVPYEFNLNEIGGLVFHDNFETVNGWTLPGEWQRGAPSGQGSGSGDPAAPWSGTSVLGTDLSGMGSAPGDYEPNQSAQALSPPLVTTGLFDLELIVRRKLGITAEDSAKIVVKPLFSQTVWVNGGAIDDDDWVELRLPVPAANNKSSVRFGFEIVSGAAGSSFGWNIDEMIVKDSKEPDYLVCGGCAGAPSFGGLVAAYDAAPCGASGVTLEWQPAAAWGTAEAGTYEVHRGDSPGFIPDETTLIVGGLTGTAFTDSFAPVNTEVWYVVRARNDEDCGGGSGLDDGNLLRLPATETTSQPLPPDLGESLRVTQVGSAHVRLSWDAVPGTDHYVVMRSDSREFDSPVELGTVTGTLFEDEGAMTDGAFHAYRVFPANSCGQLAP
jgi:subtilisin family serine protease